MLTYTQIEKKALYTTHFSVTMSDDSTVQEAMKATAPDVEKWREIITLELQTLTEKKTYKCVNESTVFWKSKSKPERFFNTYTF